MTVVLAYFAILILIGILTRGKVRSIGDFFVAGKRLGYWVASFSARATGESGWLLLGLTGMGYAVGIHAFWVVLGEVLGVTVSWIFFAQRFKVLTDRYDSITVTDYLESRFDDTSHVIRVISALVLAVMVTCYVAAQLTATGKAFNSFLGIDFTTGTIVGLAIVLFYTTVGGFLAVAVSDFIQGLLMLAALIVLPVCGVVAAGGWSNMIAALRLDDPDLITVFGRDGFTRAGVLSALGFAGVGLGFLGSPQIYVRFIAIKEQKQIVNGSLVAVLFTILTDAGAVLAGMAGRVLFPMLADQEAVMPTLSMGLFPPLLTGVMVAVVLAAIMSTADSLLILSASALVRDVYHKMINPQAPQRLLTGLSRSVTVVLGLFALIFALQEIRLIYWFALLGFAGIACAFGPVVVLSLYWQRITRAGAIAGMLAGFVVVIVWYVWFKEIVYEMIPGFILAIVVAVLVSLFTKPPAGAVADLEHVRDKVPGVFG